VILHVGYIHNAQGMSGAFPKISTRPRRCKRGAYLFQECLASTSLPDKKKKKKIKKKTSMVTTYSTGST